MNRNVNGRPTLRHAPPDFPWMLTQDEICERVTELVKSGKWTQAALGRAFGFLPTNDTQDVKRKCIRRVIYIYPGEQIKMSRVLRLIESGELVPVQSGKNKKRFDAVMVEAPPAPAPKLVAQIVGGQARLLWKAPQKFNTHDMFTQRGKWKEGDRK